MEVEAKKWKIGKCFVLMHRTGFNLHLEPRVHTGREAEWPQSLHTKHHMCTPGQDLCHLVVWLRKLRRILFIKSWTFNVFNGVKGRILTQTMNVSLLAEKAADGLCRSVNTEYFPRTLPTGMENVYSALS